MNIKLLFANLIFTIAASCQNKDGYAVIEIGVEKACHGQPCTDPKEWYLYYNYNTWIYSKNNVKIDNIYSGYCIVEGTTFDDERNRMVIHASNIMNSKGKKWDIYVKNMNTGEKNKIKLPIKKEAH